MTAPTLVRERPILFSAPMVRAILDGTKTQTRRPVKGLALEWLAPNMLTPEFVALPGNGLCPYGAPGDRLWVREAWSAQYSYPLEYRGDHLAWHHQTPPAWRLGTNAIRTHYCADRSAYDVCDYGEQGIDLVRIPMHDNNTPRWVPSIHMPRWASRITLEVTDVRVERLQEISEADAQAEGVERHFDEGVWYYGPFERGTASAVDAYRILWDAINAKRGHGWVTNPWVWVVSFRRVVDA